MVLKLILVLIVIWVQRYAVFLIILQTETKQKPTETKQIHLFIVSLQHKTVFACTV